jgi:hypothetical protein
MFIAQCSTLHLLACFSCKQSKLHNEGDCANCANYCVCRDFRLAAPAAAVPPQPMVATFSLSTHQKRTTTVHLFIVTQCANIKGLRTSALNLNLGVRFRRQTMTTSAHRYQRATENCGFSKKAIGNKLATRPAVRDRERY